MITKPVHSRISFLVAKLCICAVIVIACVKAIRGDLIIHEAIMENFFPNNDVFEDGIYNKIIDYM